MSLECEPPSERRPSATIILDVASSAIDDAYADFDIKITSGACMGQAHPSRKPDAYGVEAGCRVWRLGCGV